MLVFLLFISVGWGTIAGIAGGDLQGFYPNPTLVSNFTASGPAGSNNECAVITVDEKGRVTNLTSVALSGLTPSGLAGGVLTGTYPSIALANSGVVIASYTNPVMTITNTGRITSITSGVISRYSRYLAAATAVTTGDFLVYFDTLQTNVGWTTLSGAIFETNNAGYFYVNANVYVPAVGNLQLSLQINGVAYLQIPSIHSTTNGQTFTVTTILFLNVGDEISLSFGVAGVTYWGQSPGSRISMVYLRP